MTYDDFKSLCEHRHSVRSFEDKPVPREDVIKLLELARLAPSVENLQPWHFHILEDRGLRKKFAETCCYGNFVEISGLFIVVTCDKSAVHDAKDPVWNPKELEYSCMTAAEHILLGATAMGLDSCWVSLHHGTAHELLKLPEYQIVIGGIMLGYPRAEIAHDQLKRERKPLTDMYTVHE